MENSRKENNVPGTHGNVFKIYESGIKRNKPSIMRWPGHVARMGERRGAYRVFCGET
jgi:hypothetical protein